jgi:hypothetical protein
MAKRLMIALVLFAIISRPEQTFASESIRVSASASALKLGRTALNDYADHKWEKALAGFIAADQATQSPVFKLYIARCLKNLNRWHDARLQLESIVNGENPANAPSPWEEAQKTAKSELSTLLDMSPKLRLEFVDDNISQFRVKLDEKLVDWGHLDSKKSEILIELDPGQHNLLVSKDGLQVDLRLFEIEPAKEPFAIKLGPYTRSDKVTSEFVQPTKKPGALKPVAVATLPTHQTPTRSFPKGAYVAIGFGILGASLGTIMGIMALHERDSIVKNCGGLTCTSQYAPQLDRARLYGNLSTAAFTASGVGFTAAGVIVYVTPRNSVKQSSVGIGLSGQF